MAAELGERIQDLMREKNMSRKQLCEKTHITEAALSRYISGQREPRSITLSAIASALDVSTDELLGRPATDSEDLEDAVKLVARSAGQISEDQKHLLIAALLGW